VSTHTTPAADRALVTLWSYAKPYWKYMLLGGLLGLLGNAVALAQPLVAKWVIDTVGTDAFGVGPVVALAVLVVAGGALAALGAYVLERMAAGVVHGVRGRMVRYLLRLRVSAVERPGDLTSRVTADTTLLSRVASRSMVDAINAVLMLVGGILLMAVLDTVLLGITLSVFVLILGTAAIAMPRIARAQERTQASVGDVGAGLERVLGAFRTVKSSGAEEWETKRLIAATGRAHDYAVTTAKWTALARIAAGLSTQIAFLAVLAAGGVRVTSGDLEVSSLIAFLLYLFSMTQPIGALVQGVTDVQSGLAAVQRIDAVRRLPHEELGAGASPTPTGPARGRFEGVSFDYGSESVLDGVSFEFEPGEIMALVGGSGGGKTTIFSLLERFYDVKSGRILLDGRDVNEWSLKTLRSQIGYVEQDAPVLEGTLRENLTYSAPGGSDEELLSVVERAGLTPMVERLPQGLDTAVGHRGVTLSGGQRQRIAIARALLRKPRLLLLDEATSQLDAANEQALRKVIAEAARTSTVLVIAHRLSTVVDADRILVLDGGRIRASGTHTELLSTDELYATLSATQLVEG
jgi:ABC-type multidrug transport system fused ATPase/permease subunit